MLASGCGVRIDDRVRPLEEPTSVPITRPAVTGSGSLNPTPTERGVDDRTPTPPTRVVPRPTAVPDPAPTAVPAAPASTDPAPAPVDGEGR
jgi:hypothetical protein